jgi:hypothetical protein
MIASIFFIDQLPFLVTMPTGTGFRRGRWAGAAGGWYSEPGTGMNCSG